MIVSLVYVLLVIIYESWFYYFLSVCVFTQIWCSFLFTGTSTRYRYPVRNCCYFLQTWLQTDLPKLLYLSLSTRLASERESFALNQTSKKFLKELFFAPRRVETLSSNIKIKDGTVKKLNMQSWSSIWKRMYSNINTKHVKARKRHCSRCLCD